MNKKAFTLIELLAVIVILAIIALIAVPIIIAIINDAREASNLRSAELYLESTKLSIAKANIDGIAEDTTCIVGLNGSLTCDDVVLKVEMDNIEQVTGGIIKFQDGEIVCVSNLRIGNTTYTLEGNTLVKAPQAGGENKPCTRIGDEIICGTEHFIVKSEDASNVMTVTKYGLDVGDTMSCTTTGGGVSCTYTPVPNRTGIQNSSPQGYMYEIKKLIEGVDTELILNLMAEYTEEDLEEMLGTLDELDDSSKAVIKAEWEATSENSAEAQFYTDEYINFLIDNGINDPVLGYVNNYQTYLRNQLNVNNAVVNPPIIYASVAAEYDAETGDSYILVGDTVSVTGDTYDYSGQNDFYVKVNIPKSQIGSGSLNNACE